VAHKNNKSAIIRTSEVEYQKLPDVTSSNNEELKESSVSSEVIV
jgi:hypothetical protein